MLPSAHRLTRKKDFETAFGKGRKMYALGFGARSIERISPDRPTRFGFVVSTKVSKNAVERNRLKRLMREVIRLRVATIKPGFDVVIVAFPEAKNMEFADVGRELEKMLRKANLW